jgi:hypothetical protein
MGRIYERVCGRALGGQDLILRRVWSWVAGVEEGDAGGEEFVPGGFGGGETGGEGGELSGGVEEVGVCGVGSECDGGEEEGGGLHGWGV